MNDFVPTVKRKRGKGPRTKKAKAKREAKLLPEHERRKASRKEAVL